MLTESTPPSQNIPPPPLSTTIYDPPRIYPSLPEYTHFSTTILLYHSPRIYPSLHLSQNIPPPPLSTTICDTHRNYPSLGEHPSPLLDNYMPPSLSEYIPPHRSTTICDIPRTLPSVTDYAPFSRRFCNCERIDHLLPELKKILGERGRFWEGRIIL